MTPDPLDLYARASEWTLGKVAIAAGQLGARTPCDDWTVGELMSHMLDTSRYFIGTARGEQAPPPPPQPTTPLSADPVADFQTARDELLQAFGEDGAVERTGPSLGIAFSDALLHGWDLARATGQDETMPDGLASAAYEMIHGRFTDEQRKGVFKAEVPVAEDASAQERLLAYTGRPPST